MIGILGKKIGMTTIFKMMVPVVPRTVIEAGPCYIKIKNKDTDGYESVQFGLKRKKNSNKTNYRSVQKAKTPVLQYVKEIRDFPAGELKAGDQIK